MLKPASYMFTFIFLVLAGFVAVERTSSPFFQGCVSESDAAAIVTSYIQCSGRFIEGHGIGITALASIVIAAFTMTLWIATSRQGILTKETLIADKRAFLFASGINPMWEYDQATNQYHWRIRPIWQNSGDTPTKNLRLYSDSELLDSRLPDNFKFIEGPVPPGRGLLGPHATSMGGAVPLLPHAALSPQDIADIIQNRKFFYVWGWVRYSDVFPGTPEHVTRFCWQIVGAGDPFLFQPGQGQNTPQTLSFGYLHSNQGNCADDECST